MDTLLRFEDDHKQVEYKKFVDGLNWRENQIPAFQTIKVPLKVKRVYISKGTIHYIDIICPVLTGVPYPMETTTVFIFVYLCLFS